MENQEIEKRLKELADEKYKKFHSGLCPGTEHILGVRMPVLRNFAKEIVKTTDGMEYLKNAKDDYYEEILLQGIVIGLSKLSLEEFLMAIKRFIPKIDNWAVCDGTVAGLKITKKYPQEIWTFLQRYLFSDKEFEVRFAVVMLLDFYITPEYIHQVLEIYDKIKHEGYYVKMAVAWGISICFIKFPEETMPFLQKNHLDSFTHNKAIQKIIESYRVDETVKNELRKMKRI